MMDAGRFRMLGGLARFALRIIHRLGLGGSVLDPLRPWTKRRAPMPIPPASFRSLWRKTNGVR